ncbi:alkaline phosphatase family protein [Phenylobacterium montanum]|uniref:Alkaline phosphatase family protein n=1 Tax=Phenylobacterium montanum TaxID=2823693 RepID=A0A975FX27_9CAUL|nr:ectonucleotide pyrophosphatase/phosphodiesterase [Caulobacter sp. S6]QUD86412.1 alkaline phosphatase family protein [Caulobacter sp. S6]
MNRIVRALALALALGFSGLAGAAQAAARAPLILIALDGFRAEYLDRGETPNLAALGAEGVRAEAMRPAFPSVTNPNHYTLLTGLYPAHHGVVDNMMKDPALPGLWFGGVEDGRDNADPRWWGGATPIWITAQRAGLRTASDGWPHDWVVIKGQVPTYLEPRNPSAHVADQVDKVLAWLDLPLAQRPDFIRLHLDPTDAIGHIFGPDAPPTNMAIKQVDGAIGRLAQGLKARGLYDKVNIIIVSDHGMTEVSPARTFKLAALVDSKLVDVATFGSDLGVTPLAGHEAEVEKALLGRHPHLSCWRRAEIPAHLHYRDGPRVPPIFCLPDLGWLVVTPGGEKLYGGLKGDHGYDPNDPDMWAIFLAHGPGFRSGANLPLFENVDVYPMMTKLLALKPEPNDGRLAEVEGALK